MAITGGARGIGRATALALSARGAKVAVGDIDGELAHELASELGGDAVGVALDVTGRDSFETFLALAERRLGPLEVLINSAGVMPLGAFVTEADEIGAHALAVNLGGAMTGAKLALARFLPRDHGHLVNIAGVAGRVGFAGAVSYTASQHALVGLTTALRSELRGTGVELHLIMPVLVETEMSAGLRRPRVRRTVSADQAAAAIIAALEAGEREVFLPRSTGRILRLGALLPAPIGRRLARALRADRLLADPDPVRRAAYEARIAPRSQPDVASTVASAAESVRGAIAGDDARG